MNIVREYINEVFVEDSDPIYDLGIGIFHKLKRGDIIRCKKSIKPRVPQYPVSNFHITPDSYCVIKEINFTPKGKIKLNLVTYEKFPKWFRFPDFVFVGDEYLTLSGKKFLEHFEIPKPEEIDKLKESVNEKFIEDSDPVQDLGIGVIPKIKKWLKEHEIKRYKIRQDGTIDLYDEIYTIGKNFQDFPDYIQFNKTKLGFVIILGEITTLKGFPRHVGGNFAVYTCRLKSLEGMPKYIGGNYVIVGNDVEFTEEEIRSRCEVKGDVITSMKLNAPLQK